MERGQSKVRIADFFSVGGRRKRRRGWHENGVKKDKNVYNKNNNADKVRRQ